MGEQRTKQLQTAMKRIEKTYDETLKALGAALDLRDTRLAQRIEIALLRVLLDISVHRNDANSLGKQTNELHERSGSIGGFHDSDGSSPAGCSHMSSS